jgi:hypothetical protein
MVNIRWGVKYTSDPNKDADYLQFQSDENSDFARRGELFLNEPLSKLYYRDGEGLVKEVVSELVRPVLFYEDITELTLGTEQVGARVFIENTQECLVYLPLDSTVLLPIGTEYRVYRLGGEDIHFVGETEDIDIVGDDVIDLVNKSVRVIKIAPGRWFIEAR